MGEPGNKATTIYSHKVLGLLSVGFYTDLDANLNQWILIFLVTCLVYTDPKCWMFFTSTPFITSWYPVSGVENNYDENE